MEKVDYDHLFVLTKHYHALSPSTPLKILSPLFPTPEILSCASVQQFIVDNTIKLDDKLESEGLEAVAGGSLWRKQFWRKITDGIEEGYRIRTGNGENIEDEECHPEILNQVIRLMGVDANGPPQTCIRQYIWNDVPILDKNRPSFSSIKAVEDGRMISSGTTGLRTWKAAVNLSNHLIVTFESFLRNPSPIRVVELGSGVGLVSLVCGRIMAQHSIPGVVYATDFNENVLDQLTLNVHTNGLRNFINTSQLDWYWATNHIPQDDEKLNKWASNHQVDLVLGADVMYDPTLAPHLAATIKFILVKNPSARALMAGTIRTESTWKTFVDAFENTGFHVDFVDMKAPHPSARIVGTENLDDEGQVLLILLTIKTP